MTEPIYLGGGSHKCSKCGKTIFGSVNHVCIENQCRQVYVCRCFGDYRLCCCGVQSAVDNTLCEYYGSGNVCKSLEAME
jgi:hypothetical protein